MTKKTILVSVLSVLAASFGSAAHADAKQQCVDMVKKASAFLAANGKDKLVAEINNTKGQFADGDIYLFASDYTSNWDPNTSRSITVAHGANPKLVGKDMTDLRDADGEYFVKKMAAVSHSKEGEGWTTYKWPNPVTKQIEMKTTYTKRVDTMVVNCGVYK